MKRKMFILVCGLMLMSLCGCVATMVTEQAANQAAPPTVDNSSFDVSTPGVDVGTLDIIARHEMPAGVEKNTRYSISSILPEPSNRYGPVYFSFSS